jgi:hypothetical protein
MHIYLCVCTYIYIYLYIYMGCSHLTSSTLPYNLARLIHIYVYVCIIIYDVLLNDKYNVFPCQLIAKIYIYIFMYTYMYIHLYLNRKSILNRYLTPLRICYLYRYPHHRNVLPPMFIYVFIYMYMYIYICK